MSPLIYLRNNFDDFMSQWRSLDEDTKAWYRQAAVDEMNALDVTVK